MIRPGVRALILDDDGRVFLHRFVAADDPGVWVAPGGAVEPGETDEDALRRELREELGLEDVEVGPWVWRRRHVWAWRGVVYDTRERIALVRADSRAISPTAHDSLFVGPGYEEQHRWWTANDIAGSADVFAPRRLAALLRELQEHGPPVEPVDAGV